MREIALHPAFKLSFTLKKDRKIRKSEESGQRKKGITAFTFDTNEEQIGAEERKPKDQLNKKKVGKEGRRKEQRKIAEENRENERN